ncbi:hypothetical protein ACEODC_24985, partial [Klebsiella pneumoniae]
CHGTVCVVGRMRDLILQLSKSSIYSTKPDLHRTTAINESQAMDDLMSQWRVFFLTICVVGLLVFIACKNTTRKK